MMICKRASWQRRKFTLNPCVGVCVREGQYVCVTLLVCLSNTRHNASKKLLAKQQVDGNTEEEGKRETQRGRVRGVACLGALENNLNCHCKVGSAQRFACWGGIKKVCLVPVHSSSSTRSNYASCLLLFSQAINFCPDFTCPAPELPTHRHT